MCSSRFFVDLQCIWCLVNWTGTYRGRTTPSTAKCPRGCPSGATSDCPGITATQKPSARYGIGAFPVASNTASCAPMVQFSTNSRECATGGSTWTALVLRVCTALTKICTESRNTTTINNETSTKTITYSIVNKLSPRHCSQSLLPSSHFSTH